jgi:hypothetical protein
MIRGPGGASTAAAGMHDLSCWRLTAYLSQVNSTQCCGKAMEKQPELMRIRLRECCGKAAGKL